MKKFFKYILLGIKYELLGFLLIGIIGAAVLSWGEDEAIENCMKARPEYTYEECESAVVW